MIEIEDEEEYWENVDTFENEGLEKTIHCHDDSNK